MNVQELKVLQKLKLHFMLKLSFKVSGVLYEAYNHIYSVFVRLLEIDSITS